MELINVSDYEQLAVQRMSPVVRGYFQGGSDDEVTLRASREIFGRYRLRPRMLTGIDACDLATSVLGTPLSMPILVAPTAYHRLLHDAGECETVRGVGAAQTLMVVSTTATCSIETVAEAALGPLWFQLYALKDRGASKDLVQRAEAAGYKAIILTADVPLPGNREADRRNAFALPEGIRRANLPLPEASSQPGTAQPKAGVSGVAQHIRNDFDSRLTWEYIDWLRSITRLPIAVKGLLRGDDAQRAVEQGAGAVIVSNHGGRQLDSAVTSLEALPEIVEAVAGRCEVYLDGGIRRGTDVLKALALGAQAVLVGRPVLWGLAVNGAEGVQHVLQILRDELELALVLSGCQTLEDIDSSLVVRIS